METPRRSGNGVTRFTAPARSQRDRTRRLRKLGDQIRLLRQAQGISQGGLGKALARYQPDGMPVPQATISRWELGQTELTLEQVWDLEHALGVRAGSLGTAAGYVEPDTELEALILLADGVDPVLRRDLLTTLRAYRRSTELLGKGPAADS